MARTVAQTPTRVLQGLEGRFGGRCPPYPAWHIDDARQRLFFELNERGATVSSKVRAPLSVKGGPRSGRFVFERPFLILLRQTDGKYPYFVAWINNAELLTKVDGVEPQAPPGGVWGPPRE